MEGHVIPLLDGIIEAGAIHVSILGVAGNPKQSISPGVPVDGTDLTAH
jgi:hypothetical protein